MKAYVYVFGIPGGAIVKVGSSNNPEKRVNALRKFPGMQRGELLFARECSTRLAAFDLESRAHIHLWRARMEGEWFSIDAGEAIAGIESASRDSRCLAVARLDRPKNPRLVAAAKANWVKRREQYGPSGSYCRDRENAA